MRRLLLLGVLVTGSAEAAPVSFANQVQPLLKTRCLSCHITGTEPGKLSLVPAKAYASLVNAKAATAPKMLRVAPGKPDQSYLVRKLEGTHIAAGGTGARMPFGQAPLKPEQIKLIRDWITQGAKKN